MFGDLILDNIVKEKITTILKSSRVVLFMKGTPSFPQCGFSARAVHILHDSKISYKSIDVLEDMDIRNGIKEYASWPTIPQLYVDGEFIGGSDIMTEMYESGDFNKILTSK